MVVSRFAVLAISCAIASVCGARDTAPVPAPNSRDTDILSLESPAAVGMPVWLHVSLAGRTIQYPFGIQPASFGCYEVEVRRNGQLLPRIASASSQAFDGMVIGGMSCGFLGLPGPSQHLGRIPLHLQYRFEQPGPYKVRCTLLKDWISDRTPMFQSAWVGIEIQPGSPQARAQWLAEVGARAPSDTVGLLTDFLPSILGVLNETSLRLLLPYLHHPESVVRRFAMYGLTYWPADQVAASVMQFVRTRGPSDVAVQFLARGAKGAVASYDSLIEAVIPYLQSDSDLLLLGAIAAVRAVNFMGKSQVSQAARARLADATIGAADHIASAANSQTAAEYASALGSLEDPRAHEILWRLVNRNVARGQAAAVLTWHPMLSDLPKLAELVLTPDGEGELDRELAILPSYLRKAYGEAALPFLEKMLAGSPSTWARVESARELVLAGRPAGFRFVTDAIEQDRRYRAELVRFLRDQFPELRQSDEAAILTFVKTRAAAK